MATLTIRQLDDDLKAALRVRAARHGRSMEEEARAILRQALTQPQPAMDLGRRLVSRFASVATEIDIPPRALPRAALDWTETR